MGRLRHAFKVATRQRALILAPMRMERRPLVRQARARSLRTDVRTLHTGRVGEVEVVIAQLGVGPAVARTTTDWALKRFTVDHVVVTGIAGGLHAWPVTPLWPHRRAPTVVHG